MTTGVILAIDQGTTNTKALLVGADGAVEARSSRPLSISYPQAGWVEQDAAEIWRSVVQSAGECLAQCPAREVAAVAISNQRESTVVWDRRTGQAIGPCVTWQCRRSGDFCQGLRAVGCEQAVHERTGLTIDPMFAAGKARWLLDHAPDGMRRAERGDLCMGTVDAWLLWNLTHGEAHACDATNASRTSLMSIHDLAWDDLMLELYGIPRAVLPAIMPSSHIFGHTSAHSGLPAGLPIAAMIGDSHAALFGHGGFRPGSIKATYGTGSSLMTPMPRAVLSQRGLSTTLAWLRRQPTYALEGNILATGAAVQWLGQALGMNDPAEIERLAGTVEDSDGVYLVPAFSGLGAPHWSASARGVLCGLTRGTSAAHLARATIECIAYQVRDVFDAMAAEAGVGLTALLADGGASRNDSLMQFQADLLGCTVLRSSSPDASALGAAYLAGLAVGLWAADAQIAEIIPAHDRFEPTMVEKRREDLYAGWQRAVRRTTFDG
jgi:glycerol kinase